jgi:hypothetical protein
MKNSQPITPHNKAVAGKCGHETMNKKITKLGIVKEAPEIATASYATVMC